jgi:acetyl-CoA carboxylase biotin carboxyl carrier protein
LSERKSGKKKGAKPNKPAAKGSGPMNVELLEQIVQLMSANDLNTVDVRDGNQRIVLKRGAPTAAVQYVSPMMGAPTSAPASQSPAAAAGSSASSSAAAAESPDAGLIPIKSPMVGTFYAAPKQGEKPFVSVGSAVNEETDVCIIEAMKVFNVIKAETSGSIAKIMIQDGQPVEHGTVLFLVKPA